MAFARDDLVAELAAVWGSLLDLTDGLTGAEWDTPTPCPGWSVRDNLSHVIGTESMLLGRESPEVDVAGLAHVRNDIGTFNEVWVAERRGRPGAEVRAELAEVTGARLDQLKGVTQDEFDAEAWTPAGRATYGRFMQIRIFDCWTHEQDIREALRRPGHLEGPVAERSLDESSTGLGFVIGKRAGAPAGSTIRIDVTGPTERRFDVEVREVDGKVRASLVDDAGEPDATVATDTATFLRLMAGRIDPERPLADGRVTLAGDLDLAGRVARNLAFTV